MRTGHTVGLDDAGASDRRVAFIRDERGRETGRTIDAGADGAVEQQLTCTLDTAGSRAGHLDVTYACDPTTGIRTGHLAGDGTNDWRFTFTCDADGGFTGHEAGRDLNGTAEDFGGLAVFPAGPEQCTAQRM